jgi:pyruvate,orthophosphate dikinase
MEKWVYLFTEGHKDMRDLLGGKGAGLAEMTRAEIPVPPGFIISTAACKAYFEAGRCLPDGLWDQVLQALKHVEGLTAKRFGDPAAPLLLSVRSGAAFSMPGMMDTVLNVGLTAAMINGPSGPEAPRRFALDCYRRLIQMFGHTVKGLDDAVFEAILEDAKRHHQCQSDTALTADMLADIVAAYRQAYRDAIGEDFPDDPLAQLRQAVEAVFASWYGKRAVDYRNFNKISHDLGTAVNIMAMVFGNRDERSATGVAFTRDPASGEKVLYGEYLMHAQGEDVVAGIRTPRPIVELQRDLPEAFAQFRKICRMIETHYQDMQDLEFTIDQDRLFILQTRTGKRTARAAVAIAVDMVHEGLIKKKTAVQRIAPEQIDQLMLPVFKPESKQKALANGQWIGTGLNASPGAASGIAALDADIAKQWAEEGKAVILVRPETTPDDVHGMLPAKGILTQRGGATSHAAVVARGLGKPCITGCETLQVDVARGEIRAGDRRIQQGEPLSIDGTTGEVFMGLIDTIPADFSREGPLVELLGWADEICDKPCRYEKDGVVRKGLRVWANADYPRDARTARSFGARGIGLCRTEHMFFEPERLPWVHQMILNAGDAQRFYDTAARLSDDVRQRPNDRRLEKERQAVLERMAASEAVQKYETALTALQEMQQGDFEGLFAVMDGLPVIIRLIDPPLHEFLPRYEALLERVTELQTRLDMAALCKNALPADIGLDIPALQTERDQKTRLLEAVKAMRESNPMLGMRGIRLGISFPGIVKMQVRAIFEAACRQADRGIRVKPEIMIPLTGHVNELKHVRSLLENEALRVLEAHHARLSYKFGTMIEVPRSALTAAEIARHAEFFSFGTNDLTQMTFGYSRDDAEGKFLRRYVESGILPENPFQVIDRDGVGRLMRMAVREGRRTRSDLEIGLCGEHGGDPESIAFCHKAGLDYVSCSPYRVLVARLAAAQAVLGTIARDK